MIRRKFLGVFYRENALISSDGEPILLIIK
jgi:hypothetical protein